MVSTITRTDDNGTELLRGAAHLLRTPLAVILGMTTTLRDYDERFTSEQRTAYLGEVLLAAEEMRVALDGMSLLARLVSGTVSFKGSYAALADLIDTGREALRSVWGTEALAALPPPSGSVWIDPQRFGQALDSLARAFVPAPGATLSANGDEGPMLHLGPLAPRTHGDELDEMLRAPLDDAATAEWAGRPSGWAVLLARHLLQAQGMRLQAETAPGGLTLRICLPAASS